MEQILLFKVLAEGGWQELVEALFEGAKGTSVCIVLILIILGILKFLVPYFNEIRYDPMYDIDFSSRIPVYALGTVIFVLLGIAIALIIVMIHIQLNPPPAPASNFSLLQESTFVALAVRRLRLRICYAGSL